MFKYYGNKRKMVTSIRAAAPFHYDEYLELCAGLGTVARSVADSRVKRTIVEKDHGQAKLLQQIQSNPYEVANHLMMLGYSRDVFEEALDMKKQNYHGCSDIETAVYRKILTDQSYNAMCMTYRDIDKGDDVYVAIKAAQYRNRYTRQILPDCSSLSQELQGINIIEGDMFDYVEQLKNPGLWCTIDPPYRPSARAAGKKGYDQDWSEVTHQRLMEELWSMHMQQELKAKIMIFCYANLADLQNDLYCRYLLKMGFDLYLLKDIYLPKICSRRVHSKKKKMNTECIFINYEPVGGDIVGQGRRFTVKDVYGSDVI